MRHVTHSVSKNLSNVRSSVPWCLSVAHRGSTSPRQVTLYQLSADGGPLMVAILPAPLERVEDLQLNANTIAYLADGKDALPLLMLPVTLSDSASLAPTKPVITGGHCKHSLCWPPPDTASAGCIYLEPIEGAEDRPLEPPLVVREFGTAVVCFALSETFLAAASPGSRCYLYDLRSPTHSRLQAFRLNQAHGVIREIACHASQPRHVFRETHRAHLLYAHLNRVAKCLEDGN